MSEKKSLRGKRQQTLDHCLKELSTATAHPEQFLTVQNGLAVNFTFLTKTLYDLHKTFKTDVVLGSPLKELVIEDFDDEQIWQQLELQNEPVLQYFKKAVNGSIKDEKLCLLPESEEVDSEMDVDNEEKIEQHSNLKEKSNLVNDSLKEESKKNKKLDKIDVEKSSDFSDEDSDLNFDIDKLEQQNNKSKVFIKSKEKSIVDDKFFKLSEMESFLEDIEKEEREKKEDDEEEEVNYFEEIMSDEDGDLFTDSPKKSGKSSRNLKYKDFFDPIENEGIASDNDELSLDGDEDEVSEEDYEGISEEEEDSENMRVQLEEMKKQLEDVKRVTFALPDDRETEDTDISRKKNSSDEIKSSFEQRQEKMAERIKSLEKELLEQKPWQLQGEVTGQKRPENSLLEETLHFDHAVRMAPVITEETTLQLEDIIKQRIRDQAWDDVVRKEKPKEEAFEYKKRLTLDHEKSKLSLAEIYEQEYLKLNQQKKEEEENPEHVEIQKMMDLLFQKLDALSDFHFTPKPPVPEVKIVSNLPAITMEEVAPVHVSDAALLAPEEIKEKNKAGDIKTDAEKSATDKKRERRKKKYQKRMKLRAKEKRQQLLAKTKPEQAEKLNKAAASAQLKKLTKTGKASILKDEGKDKALKSSQAFFSQLQDQVKMQIQDAKKTQKKQKKKKEISVHKLKL
ncbi:U3 small nucleolar ribonucleoprotein protein MPP10 [Monodelphis domestica]|uniref:U3 small nucleolar ribonucleoprotein protein MPP10 n=1 Tax=Monodelphis domestica TaxID=13616 RepID=F7CBK5_MONDO|nr:U3 small nucleolar ribonucleoprotein protein MPP10 [Monodelphis domestica]